MPPPTAYDARLDQLVRDVAVVCEQARRIAQDVAEIKRAGERAVETADKRHEENTDRLDQLEETLRFARRLLGIGAAIVAAGGLLWAPLKEIGSALGAFLSGR